MMILIGWDCLFGEFCRQSLGLSPIRDTFSTTSGFDPNPLV